MDLGVEGQLVDQWTLIGANIAIIGGLLAEVVFRHREAREQKRKSAEETAELKRQIDYQNEQLKLAELGLAVAKKSFEDAKTSYENSKKSYEADVILRINDELFYKGTNAEIMKRILDEKGILTGKKRLQPYDMENFLNTIELLYTFVENKLISKVIMVDLFGYYFEEAWKNEEVQDYIQSIRKELGSDDYYLGVEKMAKM